MSGEESRQPGGLWDRRAVRFAVVVVVLAAAIAAVHGGAIGRNFGEPQWEDRHFFGHEDKHVHGVADAFRHGSYWAGLYRPLSTNLYYHAGKELFDHDRRVYHGLSALLFLINALLAFWLCRSLMSYWFSLAAAVLFATRFASAEVPLYTSQMQSLLPVCFALLALKAYLAGLERRVHPALMVLAAVLVFAALLSKESMVTVAPLCILFALVFRSWWQRPVSASRRAREVVLLALPLAAAALWWLLARDFLAVKDNRWWDYELGPLALAGNGVAYLLSFSNLVMWQVDVPGKITWLHHDPILAWAHGSLLAQVAFLGLVAASAAVLLLAIRGGRRRPGPDAVLAALGMALFVAACAPVLIFQDRLLSYYGYFGHLGLAIALVAVARYAVSRLRRESRPGVA